MNKREKETLDEIEGFGNGYDDSLIEVPGFGSCFTYLGSDSHICDELKTYDWYKEIVLLGCRKQDFPNTYSSTIEAIHTVPDQAEKRSREQWQLIERLRRDT